MSEIITVRIGEYELSGEAHRILGDTMEDKQVNLHATLEMTIKVNGWKQDEAISECTTPGP